MHLDDTIVAIATPAGRGGIGVVRLAGEQATEIARPLLRLKRPLAPGRAVFDELIDPETDDRIDEVVVTYFQKPHSYTTDDIVEISTHGSPVVTRWLVEECISRGARLAEPGEFTMRAFLNGRLDLTQAEAVRDLIESQTLFQAKSAAQQLEGALSNRLKPIKQQLIELISTLEAGVDFAEDDVSVMPDAQIRVRIAALREPLHALAATFAFGKVVHAGITMAIVGRPNVGKSSLFNRLVERERAIVASTPGTTRDLVTETVAIDGIPVRLVDTAGLRAAANEVEHIGIKKTREALADADLVLIVSDPEQTGSDAYYDEVLAASAGRPRIVVMNKCDLMNGDLRPRQVARQEEEARLLRTSALTGVGIPELRQQIAHSIGIEAGRGEAGYITNARQQGLVRDSIVALDRAEQAVANHIPHEMLLLDLHAALKSLDGITGQTTTDDILAQIFSTFCIGK